MNRTNTNRDGSMLANLLGRSNLRRTVREIEAVHSLGEVSTWKSFGNR